MGNYGRPDYSKAGSARDVADELRRALRAASSVSTDVSGAAGNTVGSLTGSSIIAVVQDGRIFGTTVDDIGALVGGAGVWLWQEVNLGSVPSYAGRFTVTFSGATVGQLARIVEYPVTMSNGELGDRCEADSVTLAGHVLSPDQITVYWRSTGPLAGLRAFAFTTVNLA